MTVSRLSSITKVSPGPVSRLICAPKPSPKIVLTQGIDGLKVISGGDAMDDPNAALSEDLAVDGRRLLTGDDEGQAGLPALLCPANQYLFGERTLATRTEVVRLVDHEPHFLGIRGKSEGLTTTGDRSLPKDEIRQPSYDQVTQTIPSLCNYGKVEDVDLIWSQDLPDLSVLLLSEDLPVMRHIQPSLNCLSGFVKAPQRETFGYAQESFKLRRPQLRNEAPFLVERYLGLPVKLVGNGQVRCNLDVEMALDAMEFAREVKPAIVVLGTGDGDFTSLAERLRLMGIRLEVAATPATISGVLLEAASGFIDLERAVRETSQEDTQEEGGEQNGDGHH